jgi:hypothetical protein
VLEKKDRTANHNLFILRDEGSKRAKKAHYARRALTQSPIKSDTGERGDNSLIRTSIEVGNRASDFTSLEVRS